MAQIVPLNIKSGVNFSKSFIVELPEGRSWWPDENSFEVLSQIREGEDQNDPLILDLKPYLSVNWQSANPPTVPLDTVTIVLVLNGNATRQITKSGYYDIVMSDTGINDDRVIVVSEGPVNRTSVVTAALEEV